MQTKGERANFQKLFAVRQCTSAPPIISLHCFQLIQGFQCYSGHHIQVFVQKVGKSDLEV